MFNLKKLFIFLVLIFLATGSAFASDFTVQKLPSGQTVIVKEVHNNPIVTIDTWIKTGSINETDSNSGISHFLEHLFFKGTKLHPAGDMDKILEAKGAIVNAATSKDFTHYYIQIPSADFDIAMDLHSDMLSDPQIPSKELEKERKVVLEEIAKDKNTPSKQTYDNLNEMLYTSHPYKRKVIGSADVISMVTREDILDYFNKFYTPSNMVTVIVGDVDTEKVLEKVAQNFNKEPGKKITKKYTKESPLQTKKQKIEYTDAKTGYMMIGFRTVPISGRDTFALDVLSQILGDGKSSKFYKNIKEQKGLAYNITASHGSFRDDGIFYIKANFMPSNLEKLEKSIFDEIKYLQKYYVTEEDLNIAKKMIEQDTYYARESTSNIASELGYIMTLTDDYDFYKNYISNIKKVSVQDVQRVAQKYLGESKCAISVTLPENLCNNKTNDNRKEHNAMLISKNNNVEKYQIDNKATLLINKHENNDIIAINILAKGGYFLEKTGGESVLVSNVMLNGTQKYSAQELANLMEENGIEIIPLADEDYFSINVKTTTAQIDLTLEILDEIINNAIYDEHEIDKKRAELLSKIRQQRDVPMNIAVENYKSLIFKDSIYSHSNKYLEKNLPKVSREDVLKYYANIFDAKNVIISVNGNIETDKLINVFGNIFSNKNLPEFKYSNYNITTLTKPENSTAKIKDLQTAWLFWGWQTNGTVNNKKDFTTLKVINTLLGSGLSSRLYRNLREQDGLAYQLGSRYTANALGGNFMAFIGTNPSTLNYAENKIYKEIERLKMEFVSDSELQRAKDRLKGSFLIALETNSEKASALSLFEVYGFGYDFITKYADIIDSITASDIVRVANKYFNDIYVKSVVKP